MAGFKTHLTGSTVVGIGYGAAAHWLHGLPLPTCALAGGLCAVAGMLPDLDHDAGRPLKESLAFSAAVIPMMLVDRFQQIGLSPEMRVLAGVAVYLFVRFIVGELIRAYTVHRGMFHSLPAAVIAGELTYLLAYGTMDVRLYKAGAVVLGCVVHLLMDEMCSIEWRRGNVRLKRSFGTALKMFSHRWWANISTYAKLGLLTFVIVYEPAWMGHLHEMGFRRPPDRIAAEAPANLVR